MSLNPLFPQRPHCVKTVYTLMKLRKFRKLLMLGMGIIVFLGSTTGVVWSLNLSTGESDKEAFIERFQIARIHGDQDGLDQLVAEMVQSNLISIGMHSETIEELFGESDTSTGIYVVRGFSIGYELGPIKFEDPNDKTFYWFHFKTDATSEEIRLGRETYCFYAWGDL